MLGIDLGTTNSLVAVWEHEKSTLVPNRYGDYLTPSAVHIGDGRVVTVGKGALELGHREPETLYRYFKRSMGTEKVFKAYGDSFTPIELSSFVLRSLKEDAERYIGREFKEAVISVPAYFNEQQRKATKTAAELAGLKVKRLINEPTAAAIAYGIQEKKDFNTVIVLDLGGGTYDVSILEYYCDVMEVKGTAGDVRLGGEDFTDCMIDSFCKDNSIILDDCTYETLLTIRNYIQDIKHRLSTDNNEVSSTIELLGKNIEWKYDNDRLMKDCEEILERIRNPIEKVIRDNGQSVTSIDEVILVGGATRMPVLRQMVTKMFRQFPIIQYNPDEVIAIGAGVLTGMIKREDKLKEVVLTDVIAYSLGINISKLKPNGYESGHFLPIIDRNTVLPVSRMENITTIADNQKKLDITIYQGESRKVINNLKIERIEFDIPPRPAGEVSVEVRFTYDTSGLLEIDVCNDETGDNKQLIIQRDKLLSKHEIESKLMKLKEYKINPEDKEVNKAFMAYLDTCYEKFIGEKRNRIDILIQRYEHSLEILSDTELNKERYKIRKVIENMKKL